MWKRVNTQSSICPWSAVVKIGRSPDGGESWFVQHADPGGRANHMGPIGRAPLVEKGKSAEAGTCGSSNLPGPVSRATTSLLRSFIARDIARRLSRSCRHISSMSTMITFAANNEFFRKRKRASPCQCATQIIMLTAAFRCPPRMRIVQEAKSEFQDRCKGCGGYLTDH